MKANGKLARTDQSIEYDDQSEVYRIDHRWDGEGSVATALATAVADIRGRDPLDLEPLYESVDLDAVDALLAGSGGASDAIVTFRYEGFRVIVRGDGTIELSTGGGDD